MIAIRDGGRAGFVTPHGKRAEVERAQRIEDLAAMAAKPLLIALGVMIVANVGLGIFAHLVLL